LIGFLVMSAMSFFAYQQYDLAQKAGAAADIDDQILSGEAPMDAYFDKGFKLWLQQKGQGLD
ncbi:MAG: hypothetical protein RLZZ502_1025, partial [Pseudomonadota bacterium]